MTSTETTIAKKNLENYRFTKPPKELDYLNIPRAICKAHASTLRRWLDFLKLVGFSNDKTGLSENKISDIKQALALYEKAGIQ